MKDLENYGNRKIQRFFDGFGLIFKFLLILEKKMIINAESFSKKLPLHCPLDTLNKNKHQKIMKHHQNINQTPEKYPHRYKFIKTEC